uniref:uncharacterized protein LOC120824356 isoform X11 n=1 Tax=Gasterosteus aculeatus aculeatus TaxID=481459 RepID=UPI001A99C259|nr:uncharacterized protein LOC120824356 isoform X11 [Gasterosteus aculeatus aculeatus]
MSGWKLCFVLLLYLPLCFNYEVSEFKTIGRGPDVTPICSNATEIITIIVCKIRTNRTGAECRLLYRHGGDFENECDSRFTLKMENQTVFLHLTGLTPVDSGNYTCECSYRGETVTLHLNITVEGKPISYFLPFYRVNSRHVSDKELFLYDVSGEEERESGVTSHTRLLNALIGATTVICITAVIFGLIYRGKRHRSRSSVRETHDSVEDDPDDPYTSLQQPAADLYQTISHSRGSKDQEVDGGDSDQSCQDTYENMTPQAARGL